MVLTAEVSVPWLHKSIFSFLCMCVEMCLKVRGGAAFTRAELQEIVRGLIAGLGTELGSSALNC